MRCAPQPDIPHIDEHVSKVECIGVKTQQKLLDIKGAAAAVGIQDLNVIHNSITTGGHSTDARNTCTLPTIPSLQVGSAQLLQNVQMLQETMFGLEKQHPAFSGGCLAASSTQRMSLALSCSQGFTMWVSDGRIAHCLLSRKRKQSI